MFWATTALINGSDTRLITHTLSRISSERCAASESWTAERWNSATGSYGRRGRDQSADPVRVSGALWRRVPPLRSATLPSTRDQRRSRVASDGGRRKADLARGISDGRGRMWSRDRRSRIHTESAREMAKRKRVRSLNVTWRTFHVQSGTAGARIDTRTRRGDSAIAVPSEWLS